VKEKKGSSFENFGFLMQENYKQRIFEIPEFAEESLLKYENLNCFGKMKKRFEENVQMGIKREVLRGE